jgi:VIT1/CCC1 family predicted Fe2+/Mn2+ transporter
MWQQWVNVVVGLAVIVVAFLGLAGATLMWTLIVAGAVVAILGLWGAMSEQDTISSSSTRHAYQ